MATWNGNALRLSHRDVRIITGRADIGATGAPTLDTSDASEGIASLARTDVGDYTLTLAEPFTNVDFASVSVLNATAASGINHVELAAVSAANKTITFTCVDEATRAATDPASGSDLYFFIIVRNR